MSRASITNPGSSGGANVGGILHLPVALERYPDYGFVVYNRVSSWSQAGKGKVKLQEKTDAVFHQVRKRAPGRVRRMPFFGVEEGKLSSARPKLLAAARYATDPYNIRHRGPMFLVASDLSRLIRSEDYHRRTNPDAWPTPEEFAEFRQMTFGVICATLADPLMTEMERHARTMERAKQTGKCGRPRKIGHQLAYRILQALGMPFNSRGRVIWDEGASSLGSVAKQFERYGVDKQTVQRLVDSKVPRELCKGRTGQRWKDCSRPAEAYRIAYDKGLLRGEWSMTVSNPDEGEEDGGTSLFA
jgi:hypothetical protein